MTLVSVSERITGLRGDEANGMALLSRQKWTPVMTLKSIFAVAVYEIKRRLY